jgi:hypothetical protein
MKRSKPYKPFWEMTTAELREATRQFDAGDGGAAIKPPPDALAQQRRARQKKGPQIVDTANKAPKRAPDAVGDLSASMRAGLRHMIASRSIEIGPIDAQAAGLASAIENFDANFMRLRFLAQLPVEAFEYGIAFHMLHVEVRRENPGMDPLPKKDEAEADPSLASLVFTSKLNETLLECLNGKHKLPRIDAFNYLQVAGLAVLGTNWVGKSIEAFNASLLTQAWIAFEILSEDLWKAAQTMRPSRFPKSSGRFQSLAAIRRTYQQPFSANSNGVFNILNDPWLDYAAAVRNVLIHKNGKIDPEFRAQVAKLELPEVVSPVDGENFPLTGMLTATLVDHVFDRGLALIKAVHDWVLSN